MYVSYDFIIFHDAPLEGIESLKFALLLQLELHARLRMQNQIGVSSLLRLLVSVIRCHPHHVHNRQCVLFHMFFYKYDLCRKFSQMCFDFRQESNGQQNDSFSKYEDFKSNWGAVHAAPEYFLISTDLLKVSFCRRLDFGAKSKDICGNFLEGGWTYDGTVFEKLLRSNGMKSPSSSCFTVKRWLQIYLFEAHQLEGPSIFCLLYLIANLMGGYIIIIRGMPSWQTFQF